MIDIEVSTDIVNNIAQRQCRKRKLDYEKTLNLYAEIQTYEKAQAVEKCKPLFKWETSGGTMRLFIEKLVSKGFVDLTQGVTHSKKEINKKFNIHAMSVGGNNGGNQLQVDRESYK